MSSTRCSVAAGGPLKRLVVEVRRGAVWTVRPMVGREAMNHAPPRSGPAGLVAGLDHATLLAADRSLRGFFRGAVRGFDSLELAERGTAFQREVWAATREVLWGETITYGELAERLGRPAASRAVGAALGANPFLVVVPCHRVVGADGSLTGFACGVEAKRWLLEREREEPAGGSTLFGDD